ncbi:MAG: VTT domain-containing protein, partial [Nitrososphaerota archaeon]|nr:VTT domain-containing protein [Nitrososphaerota archaeon]
FLSVIAAIRYFGRRFGGWALILKALSYGAINENDIEVADRWLARHGPFSIFMSTFVPYFRNVTSLAAGTLKMNAGYYAISNLVGYFLRALFLLYLGYTGLDVLTPSFDYRYRLPLLFTAVFMALMIAMTALMMYEIRPAAGKRDPDP